MESCRHTVEPAMQRPRLTLRRATPQNGLFVALKAQWTQQLEAAEDPPLGYYEPMMDHAERVAAEDPQDKRYGIFVLLEGGDNGDGGNATYEGLVHINHAWPKSKDATLRLVWNLIAPKYQFEEISAQALARIMTGFITESLALCGNDMPSRELKLYLGNAIDREYATIAASVMAAREPDFGFAIRGGWLHIKVTP
jgi:hypothetical protein